MKWIKMSEEIKCPADEWANDGNPFGGHIVGQCCHLYRRHAELSLPLGRRKLAYGDWKNADNYAALKSQIHLTILSADRYKI